MNAMRRRIIQSGGKGLRVGGRASAAENCRRDLHGSPSFGPCGNSWTEACRHRRDPNRGAKRYRGCPGGAGCSDAGAWQQRDHAPKSYWLRVTTFTDAELNAKFSKLTRDATPAPMRFFAFKDPEQQTKDQIEMVRSHPWISKEVPVRGPHFRCQHGRLLEVLAHAEAAS